MGSIGELLRRVAHIYRRVWHQMALPLAVIFVAYVVSLMLVAVVMRPLLVSQAHNVRTSAFGLTALAITVLVPIVVLLGVAGVVWGGATLYVADGAAAERATSPWRSVVQALRRVPAGLGALLTWFFAVAVTFVLFPLFMVAGALGLLLTPLARRTRLASRWPSVRVLIVMLVPFSVAFLLLTRWSLALGSVFLDRVGVRRALANSWDSVRGRTGTVAAVLAAITIAIFVLTFAVRFVVEQLMSGDARLIVSQVSVQLFVAPLLIVAIAVLYRAHGPGRPERPGLAPVPGSHRVGVATLLVIAVIAQISVLVIPHGVAYADPVAEATPTTEPVPTTEAAPAAPEAAAPTSAAPAAVGSTAALVPAGPPVCDFPGHANVPDVIVQAGPLDAPVAAGVPIAFNVTAQCGRQGCSCEPSQPSGDITVLVDGVPLPPPNPQTLASGTQGFPNPNTLPFSATFTAGTHAVRMDYAGDADFAAATRTVIVVAGDPTVTTQVTTPTLPKVFGEPVTYAATVGPGTPTGIVNFVGRNALSAVTFSLPATLVGGTATLTTTAIPAGVHAVTAEYQGGGTDAPSSSAPEPLEVTPAFTDTDLSVSPTTATEPGETVTASVRVTQRAPSEVAPRGTVQISAGSAVIGTAALTDGQGTVGVVPPPGSRELTATYVPAEGNWYSSTDSRFHTVNALAPQLKLTAGSNPSAYGAPLTLTATVIAGSPATGTVTFVARGQGAPATGTSAAAVSHSANLDDPLPADADVPFSVRLAPPPSGGGLPSGVVTVRVDDGAVPVTPATRTLPPGATLTDLDFTASFPPGPHVITVSYAGDGSYAPQDQVIDVVARAPDGVKLKTTSSSGSSGSSSASGSAASSTSVVGDVNLGTVPLDGAGQATVTTADLRPGQYVIEARYSGNGTIQPLVSQPLPHTIGRVPVTVSASTSSAAPELGDAVTVDVEVAVSGAGAGLGADLSRQKVTLLDGSDEVGSALLSGGAATGSASITFHVSGVGARTLTAVFGGDDVVDAGRGSVGIAVAPRPTGVRMFGALHRGANYGDVVTFDGVITTPGSEIPTGTVQLESTAGVLDTGTVDAQGRFSFTTKALPAGHNLVWVSYGGDARFLPSSVIDGLPAQDGRIVVEVARAHAVPEVAFSRSDVTVGEDMTVTATLHPTPGAGPTGTVTFYDVSVSPRELLGSAPVVDGVATLTVAPGHARTLVLASYAGDRNFAASESASPYALLQAAPASATLAFETPAAPLVVGKTFTLAVVATSSAGGPARGAITFRRPGGTALASNVPLVGGRAEVDVCGGDATACPSGVATLPAGTNEVVAEYTSNTGGAAVPARITLDVGAAPTTLTLTSPSVVIQGSAVPLVAVVTAGGKPVAGGNVAFSAVQTGANGAAANQHLANVTVGADGRATFDATVGTDLEWPTDSIRAEYTPAAPAFGRSSAVNPITIRRIPTALDASTPAAPVGQPTNIAPTVTALEPGTSKKPGGPIQISADNGTKCTAPCTVTWDTAADHSFTATYAGDATFEPAKTTAFTVSGTKGTPALHPQTTSPATVGVASEVTWVPPRGATGTVTVLNEAGVFCEADVTVGRCTGTFGPEAIQSRQNQPADRQAYSSLRVRYPGDGNWSSSEDEVLARVTGCYPVAVTSRAPARGSVTVDTPSNCGTDGYLAGTEVHVTATPVAPNEFRGWLRPDDPKPFAGAKDLATSFVVTDDFASRSLDAQFALPCLNVDEKITGKGALDKSPEPDCTLADGSDGYSYGTVVDVTARGVQNPDYDEPDAFYKFDPIPAGAETIGVGDSQPTAGDTADTGTAPATTRVATEPRLRVTLTTDVEIGAEFGPLCRTVQVSVDPKSDGDQAEVVTPTNCTSPQADGYFRGTKVKVKATSGDTKLGRDGWTVNGAAAPDLGRDAEADVEIGATTTPSSDTTPASTPEATPAATTDATTTPDLAVAAHYVPCFDVKASTGVAFDAAGKPLGKVTLDPAPNCPDGSDRYLGGTSVTLEPVALADGATFSGWQDSPDSAAPSDAAAAAADAPRSLDGSERDPTAGGADQVCRFGSVLEGGVCVDPGVQAGTLPPGSPGVGPTGTRTVVVNHDLTTTAGFYLASVCSRLFVNAPPGLVSFTASTTDGANGPSGCGPGFYYDAAKAFCAKHDCPPAATDDEIRAKGTFLTPHVDPTNQLPLFAEVTGNADACFPLGCAGRSDTSGQVTGDLSISFDACQSIEQNVRIGVVGDDSGHFYSPYDFGSEMGDYPWVVGEALNGTACSGGTGTRTASSSGSFPTDTDVALRTSPPAKGFIFQGWDVVDNLLGTFADDAPHVTAATDTSPARGFDTNGVVVRTTKDRPTLKADAVYAAVCGTLSVGEGITAVSPPNCPAGADGVPRYVVGSFVTVSAQDKIGNRFFRGYTKGVVAGTVDDQHNARVCICGASTTVAASYPTFGDEVVTGLAIVGKYAVGVLAVAAPIVLTAMCGPCGIAIAALTMSTLLIDLIPGVGGKATAALQGTLLTPFTLADCSARWGFGNSKDLPPPQGTPDIQDLAVAGGKMYTYGAKGFYAATTGPTLSADAGLGAMGLKSWTKPVSNFKLATSSAAFVYGVYDAGGFNTDFTSFQTVDQLRDTASFTSCMSQPYDKLTS